MSKGNSFPGTIFASMLLLVLTAGFATRAVAADIIALGRPTSYDLANRLAGNSPPPLSVDWDVTGDGSTDVVDLLAANLSGEKCRLVCRLMGAGLTETNTDQPWSGDLGVMAFHQGQVHVMTGDTMGAQGVFAPNVMARTSDLQAADGLDLTWDSRPINGYPKEFFPRIDPDSTVPAGAISLNGILYVFMMDVTHWKQNLDDHTNARAVLIKSSDDGAHFSQVWIWDVDNKFVNIAPVLGAHPLWPGMQAVYLVGSGPYRESPIYLAACEAQSIENRSGYLYFKGFSGGSARWGSQESEAVPTVNGVKVGELSVQWNDYLNGWLLSCFDYNSGELYFRSAAALCGPWSEPKLVFARKKHYWYDQSWSGPYGGYLLRELDRAGGRVVYFILSLWVPYNIFLMETDLQEIFGSN